MARKKHQRIIARRLSRRGDLEAHRHLVHQRRGNFEQSRQLCGIGKTLSNIHGRAGGCKPLASLCDEQRDGPPMEQKASPARSCSQTTKLNGMRGQAARVFRIFVFLLHAPGPFRPLRRAVAPNSFRRLARGREGHILNKEPVVGVLVIHLANDIGL